MNERIKELMQQSYVTVQSPSGEGYTDFSQEKFAEAVIRECGVALSPMLRDMISRGQAFDLIKQHFGVEE